MKKELKHKVKRKEKEKEEVMGRCSGCGESLLQLKGRMMHRSFSISIATRTPALSRQSPLIKLPILPPYNEIEHRGVAKCVCLLLHTHTHTHPKTHRYCHSNADSTTQKERQQCGSLSLEIESNSTSTALLLR